MRIRNVAISVVVALLFLGSFAQEPPGGGPGKEAPLRGDTVAAERPAETEGDRAIVNIRSRRMFPVKVGDSTVYAFVGNVVAYHNGAVMLCDSAVRYDENRMECFRNVLINKDSTYVYGDRVVYDRRTNRAQVFSPLIKMIDGEAVLYTYNFVYNTLDNVGEFYGGGTMSQGQMLLESDRGYYFGNTRDAVCVGNAELRDSTYQIISDSLGYNMDSEIATFYRKTYIWNEKNEILSADRGWYDTRAERYHFMSNAYVLSEDQEIWADDMDYLAENDNVELRRNIQILDDGQKVLAFGDYGRYWGESGNAMLTDNPSAISYYEKGDSLYMRADSIFMFVIDSTSIYSADYIGNKPEEIPDTGEELIVAPAGNGAGADTAAVAPQYDSAVADTMEVADSTHVASTVTDAADDVSGQEEFVAVAEVETAAEGDVIQPGGEEAAVVSEQEGQTLTKKQLRAERREARRKKREERRAARLAKMEESAAEDAASSSGDESAEEEQTAAEPAAEEQAEAEQTVSAEDAGSDGQTEEEKERVIVGYYNVKIYRADMQAVCDSLISFSRDTTIHLHKSPVMWNGDNQIKSDLVVAYVKDEAIDHAVFYGGDMYGNPVMSAELDLDHYNQITGKTIEALFRDNEIYRTNVVGNAQTYYYMQDEESGAFQGFLVMECSDITFMIAGREIDEIIFRGNPAYTIYPMDLIPAEQAQRLTNFVWEGDKCPTKEEVFDRDINPSQREEYENLPKPQFPLTESISIYRSRIMDDGIWRDRNDDVPPDAMEYVRRLQLQGL